MTEQKPYHRKPFKSAAFFGNTSKGDCILCCAFFPFSDGDLGTFKYYDIGYEKNDETSYKASTRTLTASKAWDEILEFDREYRKTLETVNPSGEHAHLLPDEYKQTLHIADILKQQRSTSTDFAQSATDKKIDDMLKKIDAIKKSAVLRPRR